MRELDQKLLDFGITESFDENDYYVSKSNYFAKNLKSNFLIKNSSDSWLLFLLYPKQKELSVL